MITTAHDNDVRITAKNQIMIFCIKALLSLITMSLFLNMFKYISSSFACSMLYFTEIQFTYCFLQKLFKILTLEVTITEVSQENKLTKPYRRKYLPIKWFWPQNVCFKVLALLLKLDFIFLK